MRNEPQNVNARTPRYLLVPFDGSVSSKEALNLAFEMAEAFRTKLAIVSVVEPAKTFVDSLKEIEREQTRQKQYYERIQKEARALAKGRRLEFERTDIVFGHVSQNIVNYAKKINCDLIVLGHSGVSGVWNNFLGTTAEKVSRHAHCTVVIVR